MTREISLWDIESALRDGHAANEALSTWTRGPDAHDRYRERRDCIERGLATLRRLNEVWPNAKALLAAEARAYDAYVTRDPEPCCSCHLSAPCGFCTSQPDEEAEAA